MAICGSSLGALATFCNLPPKVSVDGSSTTRWIPAADFATKWKWQPAPCQPTLLKAHRGIKQATRRSCDCLMWHELEGDFLNWLMRHGASMWHTDDQRYTQVRNHQFNDAPTLTQNYLAEISEYLLAEHARFATLLRTDDSIHSACVIVVLCERVKQLLTAQINKRLGDFKNEGGFTEKMTQARLSTVKEKAEKDNAPQCPKCGAPMRLRTIKKGARQGETFWGCTDYPKCDGTKKK